jgi:hypothetical protein
VPPNTNKGNHAVVALNRSSPSTPSAYPDVLILSAVEQQPAAEPGQAAGAVQRLAGAVGQMHFCPVSPAIGVTRSSRDGLFCPPERGLVHRRRLQSADRSKPLSIGNCTVTVITVLCDRLVSVTIAGEIDSATPNHWTVRCRAREPVTGHRRRGDFHAVAFCDRSGLDALERAHAAASMTGSRRAA